MCSSVFDMFFSFFFTLEVTKRTRKEAEQKEKQGEFFSEFRDNTIIIEPRLSGLFLSGPNFFMNINNCCDLVCDPFKRLLQERITLCFSNFNCNLMLEVIDRELK